MRIRKLVPSRRCAVLPLTSTDVAGEVVMSPMLLRAPFFRRSLSFAFASSSLAFFHLTRSFQHSNATPFSFSFPPALSSSSSLEVCTCSFSLFRVSFPRSPPFASSTRNDLSRAERALNRHLKSAPTPSLSHSECGFISTRYARARERVHRREHVGRWSNDVRARRVRSSRSMEDLHSSSSRIGNPTVRPDALK